MIMRKSFVACLFFLGLSACVSQPAFSEERIRADQIKQEDIIAIGRGINYDASICFYDDIIEQLSYIENYDKISSWIVITDDSIQLHHSDGSKTACFLNRVGVYTPNGGWRYEDYDQ